MPLITLRNITVSFGSVPVLKEVKPISIPYLIDEVIAIFHYLHDNRGKIKKK